MNKVLKYFPDKIQEILYQEFSEDLEEIRVRVQKPIVLKFNKYEKIIRYFVNRDEIINILQLLCENSIYSYQKEIAEGFITVDGGHRVGISGSCVIENQKIININYINSLNFRIAKQVIGCSKDILDKIISSNDLLNTLIISPPGAGKTTILRDIVRQVSNGIKNINFDGINVGLVDERGEIASLYKGVPQNDVGIRTDVIENVKKAVGMKMLIRSMAPQVVVADEIGGIEDIEAINYAICSGCKGIFTAHGKNFNDLILNPVLKKLISTNIFDILIFLDVNEKGKIKETYLLDKNCLEYKKEKIV